MYHFIVLTNVQHIKFLLIKLMTLPLVIQPQNIQPTTKRLQHFATAQGQHNLYPYRSPQTTRLYHTEDKLNPRFQTEHT